MLPSQLVSRQGLKTPRQAVDYFLQLLVDGDVPDTRAAGWSNTWRPTSTARRRMASKNDADARCKAARAGTFDNESADLSISLTKP